MTKILFLGANPRDLTQLKLYQEIFEVSSEVRRASFGDQFKFEPKVSVKWRDLSELLRTSKPDILHFSGHGSESSELIFEDEQGESQPVSEKSIRTVFRILKGNIKCVVLNACYGELQANEIAEHIDCVVGTSSKLADQEAISFSREFYRQLADGRSVLDSYELGCTHVTAGKQQVKLIHPNADASKIRFVPDAPSSTALEQPTAQAGPVKTINIYSPGSSKRFTTGLLVRVIGAIIALMAAVAVGYYLGTTPTLPPSITALLQALRIASPRLPSCPETKNAKLLFNEGVKAFGERNAIALKSFEQAINCGLQSAEVYFYAGMACHRLRYNDENCSYDRAIQYYDEAIKLDSQNADYYAERAWTYRHFDQPNYVENLNKAIADWSMAFELDHELPGARPIWYAYRGHVYDELVKLGYSQMEDNARQDCQTFLDLTKNQPNHEAWKDLRANISSIQLC